MKKEEIKDAVKKGYSKIAQENLSCYVPAHSCCCSTAELATSIGKNIGYTEEELMSVPDGANLGLGCGNPIALASLQPGETVVDLGSGAGFDSFLAAQKVGPLGKVIGVDMTPAMIHKAEENARAGGYTNVEFRLGDIEHLPLEDNAADAVISNCVINLSPEKEKVFAEALRVLRPGGRIMVSDIVLLKELPEEIKNSVAGYIGCLSGAVMKDEYLELIKAAGFQDINVLEDIPFRIEYMPHDPAGHAVLCDLQIPGEKTSIVENSVVSIKVSGVKADTV